MGKVIVCANKTGGQHTAGQAGARAPLGLGAAVQRGDRVGIKRQGAWHFHGSQYIVLRWNMQAYIYKERHRTLMHSYAQQGTIGNNVGRLSAVIRRVRDSLRALHLRRLGNGSRGGGRRGFPRLFRRLQRTL